MPHEELTLLWQILLAMALGGAIGLERELAGKPAGLRTNMLTAAAAALLAGLATSMVEAFSQQAELTEGAIRTDPIRVFEAVVTGLSFLGAGTIIRQRGEGVEGLTSAATILLTGSLGLAVALEQYALAIAVTAVVIIILVGLGRLEAFLHQRKKRNQPALKYPSIPTGCFQIHSLPAACLSICLILQSAGAICEPATQPTRPEAVGLQAGT